jgi:hypothetical protein
MAGLGADNPALSHQKYKGRTLTTRPRRSHQCQILISADTDKNILRKYCHVFQRLRRGFGLVNRLIGSSLVVTTISSYTLKITVTIAHVTPHTLNLLILLLATLQFPWNFGTQVKSIPIPVFSHILSARTTLRKHSLLLRSADHTENKSRDNYLASPLTRWLLPSNEL